MKVASFAVLAGLVSATSVVALQPFQNVGNRGFSRFSVQSEKESSPCTMPDVVPETVTAKALRSSMLTNADGNVVNLGEKMGQGTSIVVFLRHLGCPYCWNYANSWCEVQQKKMAGSNIAGPFFVSIGDEDKLSAFLEKNPSVPRENAFVDDYSFGAYEAAGFGKFDDVSKEVAKEAMGNMGAPALGAKGWWNYFTSASKLSPIPKEMKFGEVPEGVLRLGGTFVVKGNDIVYGWSDRLPGDHPDIENVLGKAEEASKQEYILQNIFGL
eukprot:scaffold1327_cov124-Cylindrotheca_fusiformis.AAC.12